MHYWAFIDETGINKMDRFFGVGILSIEDTGLLYEKLRKRYDQLQALAQQNKYLRIETWKEEGRIDELAAMAKGGKDFELKFKRVNATNSSLYRDLIEDYFSIPNARFTALMVDRNDPNFKPIKAFPGTWEAYLTYSSMLIAREIANLQGNVCALVDYISKPTNIPQTFEAEMIKRTTAFTKKRNCNISGLMCTQMESHANLMIQLVDILLGSVAFDYKDKNSLLTDKLKIRKAEPVKRLKEILDRESLVGTFTVHKPSYFSVWEMKWK